MTYIKQHKFLRNSVRIIQSLHQLSSSSRITPSTLVQAVPLQLPHAGEHFTLYFLHVHLIVLQSVWQLHLIILSRSSGAGGKSVNNGIRVPSHSFHPHSSG